MNIKYIDLSESDRKPMPQELGFGGSFANRMFMQYYAPDKGWYDATIGPYRPLTLDPATAVFHYAQEIFEGAKAYRRPDGNINLFRTWENAKRFNQSATRMAMPTVDEEDHLEAIVQLIALEQEWVPDAPGALYIRPTMIAADPTLGVHASKTYIHYVIVGPVGSYFREGFSPVPVYISDTYRRAVRGGTGAAKTGGNYAASLFVGTEAKAKGYSQVLWLDAIEGRYVEEVGAMNIYFVYEGQKLVTPPLSGSILPGVTRNSVLTLGKDLGYEVSEEPVDVNEMLADIQSGKISEVFGCGTAAVIAPVGKFGFKDKEYVINDYEVGPVAQQLYETLTGIQYGRIEDKFGWTQVIQVK
ncbi:MAG: branched-chain amino acid aminotransferase [Ardenticatenaceae bacterium]|nr:branched-chain amino acid aminotransferase [Anaerolineales bacterium]MCB8965556.1 branched-chain amino acid aminotransferase [Ardenticatenaceae bacterium]MCB8989281.1 branched-chain amino acid aminotransferase [Ardenticatenaceae bacterium]